MELNKNFYETAQTHKQRDIITRTIFYMVHFDSYAASPVIFSRFRDRNKAFALSQRVRFGNKGAL